VTAIAIVVNGDRTEVEEGLTVADLLEHYRVTPQRVVVEHNRRVLRGDELSSVLVSEGDELELVQFVGGG
jgi:sulfur carrier protein